MPVPVLVAVDPVTVELAPARFGSLLAAIAGASLTLAAVHGGEDVLNPLVVPSSARSSRATPTPRSSRRSPATRSTSMC